MQNIDETNENRFIPKKCGLGNLGNTCFINSILQALLVIPELNNLLNDKSYKNNLNDDINSLLLIEWDSLREDMLKGTSDAISPNRFIAVVHHIAKIKKVNLFADYYQNDVTEFLLFLIDCFHLALKRNVIINITGSSQSDQDELAIKCYEIIKKMYETNYSEIFNIFHGIYATQIFSENDELLSSNLEPFYSINLHLPPLNENKNPSLNECFKLYTENEILNGDNMFFYEKLGRKIVAKKKILFWSLPKILIIDIKRYNNNNMKLRQLLNFPIDNLNLSEYVIGYEPKQYIYDLIAICNHSGITAGGHYTSFVRDKNQWYLCNDTNITKIDDLNQIITPKAYCFFYKKR